MSSSTKSATCAGCNQVRNVGLNRCAGCKQTMYCSRQCQKAHWSEHKVDCRKMLDPQGRPPIQSNPVIALGRRVNLCGPLLEWVDWVLIASLDLVNHPENALVHSVSLVSSVKPVPESAIVKGKQIMQLTVDCAQVQPSIEPHCLEMSTNELRRLSSQGMDVSHLIFAHYQWHPFPIPNVLYNTRFITPKKLQKFRRLHVELDGHVPSLRPHNKYIQCLNAKMASAQYAGVTTMKVVVSDHQNLQRLADETIQRGIQELIQASR